MRTFDAYGELPETFKLYLNADQNITNISTKCKVNDLENTISKGWVDVYIYYRDSDTDKYYPLYDENSEPVIARLDGYLHWTINETEETKKSVISQYQLLVGR